jgi:hypothetical protein
VKQPLCEACTAFMGTLLDKRIRAILAVSADEGGREHEIGQSHCFHLMEIQRILKGETTCGVYDEYAAPMAAGSAEGAR